MALSVAHTELVYRAGSLLTANDHFVRGDAVRPQYTASGAVGPLTWSDNGAGGAWSIISGSSRYYVPKNRSRLITLTIGDGVTTVNKTLQVFGTMPLFPTKGYKFGVGRTTKTREAQDETAYFRRSVRRWTAWQLPFERRETIELDEFLGFWLDHERTELFYVVDGEIKKMAKVRFLTDVEPEFNSACTWSWNAQVKGFYTGEVYAYP